MLYVTDRAIYFSSIFNDGTVFGSGTRINIPLEMIEAVKKESTLKIFPNAIRIVVKETG